MLSVVSSLCTSTFYWLKLLVKLQQAEGESLVTDPCRIPLTIQSVSRSHALAGNQTPEQHWRSSSAESTPFSRFQVFWWTVSLNFSEVLWFSFSSAQTSVLFCWPQISFVLWMSLMGFESLDGASVGGPGLSEVVSVWWCYFVRTQPDIINAPWNHDGVLRHRPEMERTTKVPSTVFFHVLMYFLLKQEVWAEHSHWVC